MHPTAEQAASTPAVDPKKNGKKPVINWLGRYRPVLLY